MAMVWSSLALTGCLFSSLVPRPIFDALALWPDMAINGVRNKRSGPGGSTRRLHHHTSGRPIRRSLSEAYGGETGSTRAVKVHLLLGMIPPLSGHFTNANDNHEAFAIAA